MKKIIGFSKVLMTAFLFCAGVLSVVLAADSKGQTVEDKLPGLAMSLLKTAILADMKPETLLTAEGIEIRKSDIDAILDQMPPDNRKQWQQNLFFILEQEASEKVLLLLASKQGVSAEGLSEREIIQAHLNRIAENVSVSDEEAKAFYDSNKEMIGNLSFDQIKDSIKVFAMNQKKQEAIDTYVSDLGSAVAIQVNREWTESQDKIVKDNPVDKARASGKPTMAEFGAAGCVPCDLMQPILDKLRRNHGDRLNVVFAHVHENPMLSARFGIRAIPVQIFFDKHGKEVFRHTGFFPETEVMKQLEKIGVK